ncbi:MAG: ABC transporter substrate-binding protein [Sphaerochaetaceae bacterium]|nr:ABC transporter substrate-binding protein [Sphaerochaetaceae bacterium]
MKKFSVVLLVALVAVAAAFAGGSNESAASEVKIGFIGPLTGDYANYGVRCYQAVQLAVNEANAAGGINGKQITLIAEDSEGASDKALAGFEKLVNNDKVCAIVGAVLTGETLAVAEKAQEEGVLLISPSASADGVTDIGDFIFRTTPNDGLQGKVAGYYFAQVLGVKNLGVLYAKNDYSQGLYEGMKEAFEAAGGKIALAETCMVGDKDFKTQLTKLRNANVDAVYIPNYTVEMAQQLEQAAQLGMSMQFLSGDGFTDAQIYSLAGDYTNGVIYTGPTPGKENAAFVSNFKKAFDVDPGTFSTNAYDAANIVIAAIAKAGTDRTAIRNAVAATKDYEGVLGTINFESNGDLVATTGVYLVVNQAPVFQGNYTVVDGVLSEVK